MQNLITRFVIMTTCIFIFSNFSTVLASSVKQQVEKPIRQAIDTRQGTQKIVDKWQNDKMELTARFDALTTETEQLAEYLEQLENRMEIIRKRLAQKEQQLDETQKITDEITPFLDELLGQLRAVRQDGPPFLLAERSSRLEKMEEMMSDSTVPIGEKYRRLMEALHIEAEYGFTSEVYQETIETDQGKSLVEILRLGRLNLFYLGLDGKECGFYDEAEDKWKLLDKKWLRGVTEAIAIAKKERPVNLVALPLGTIQDQQQ